MRRLDSLECERAMEELNLLVQEGRLSKEDAAPAIRALWRQGMSDEADERFDESCLRLTRFTSIVVVVVDATDDDVPFAFDEEPALEAPEEQWLPFDDDPSELGYDPYAGQDLDDDPPDFDTADDFFAQFEIEE